MMSDKEHKEFWDKVREGKLYFSQKAQNYFNFKTVENARKLGARVDRLERVMNNLCTKYLSQARCEDCPFFYEEEGLFSSCLAEHPYNWSDKDKEGNSDG